MGSDTSGKTEVNTTYVVSPVYFVATGAGLIRRSSHPNLLSFRVSMVSQCIINALLNKLFSIMVENLSKTPTHLPELMFVGVVVDVPKRIFSFSVGEEQSLTSIPHYEGS